MTQADILFNKPLCLEQSYNIIFPRFFNIRRTSNDLEDQLSSLYNKPNLLSIPDDFEPQAPRVIFQSKTGHSQIIFSQENVVLNVKYSTEWGENIERGRNYLQERIAILIQIITKIFGSNPLFQGLTTSIFLRTTQSESEILQFLSDRLLKNCEGKKIQEISLKISEIVEDKYFSNTTFQSIRFWNQGQNGVMSPLSKDSAVLRGIQVIGDYNDRYSYNECQNYLSPPDIWKVLIADGFRKVFAEIDHLTL